MNPCTYGTTKCGHNAECLAQNHRANCACSPGTQGDPLISCVTGVCQYNDDCRDDEACDRLNRVCRPVCDSDSCASTAICEGHKHQPVCTCRPGTNGNPYLECTEIRHLTTPTEPECRVDADCPSQLACFNQHCENPCAKPNICAAEQTCSVFDSLPLRTVMCKCPIDTITDNTGHCVPVAHDQPQCRLDEECPDSDKCVSGTCRLACSVEQCGVNAQCQSTKHRAVCSCAAGYEGNPRFECSSSNLFILFFFFPMFHIYII